MDHIAIDDAVLGFQQIADRVANNGEPVILTRDGQAVLKVSPVEPLSDEPVDLEARQKFLETLKELRKTVKFATHEEIRADIEEGRR